MVSPSSSFLAVLQTFNEPLANKLVDWFRKVVVISANDIRTPIETLSIPMMADDNRRSEIVSFLKSFDINIEDAKLHEIRVEDIPDKIRTIVANDKKDGTFYDGVNMAHKLYNELYEKVGNAWFSMERDESYGTNRLFWLSWAIISALKNGTVLFIDEFDSGIHPSVAKLIIELFYRCNSTAQLIINTQNSSFLNSKIDKNKKLFTKYQIFLVNKNRYGESVLIPLTDFKLDLRSKLDELYLSGALSGTPYINSEAVLSLLEGKNNG
jgi:AAA15 family ATPase/GTPase